MRVGIAFDLKQDFAVPQGREDLLEEYDCIETVSALGSEIARLGHEVVLLRGGRKFVENILSTPVDLVFNMAEGRGGRCRESQVPALCEMLGVPCTHSDALSLGMSLDKSLAGRVARGAGVPTPFQVVVESEREAREASPPLPVVLKPIHEGSSMGVRNDSLVRTEADLGKKAISMIRRYRQPVIIEEFLPGKELTVGIVGNDPPEVLGVMEIAPIKKPVEEFLYSMETKRDFRRLVAYHCPPVGLPESSIVEAGRMALEVFRAFGCRDAARVDMRLDREGRARFIEINPLPGISPTYSDLCIMASLAGVTYGELIERILDAATRRLGLGTFHAARKKSPKKRPCAAPSTRPGI